MRRRSGQNIGRGRSYGGPLWLTIGALGIGALIALLARNRRAAREKAESTYETARSTAEEHVGARTQGTELQGTEPQGAEPQGAEPQGAEPQETPERAPDEERGAGEDQGEGAAQGQESGGEEPRGEMRSIIRESVRRSEEHSSYREESSTGEAVEEETSRTSESRTSERDTGESRTSESSTSESESRSGQVTVVGLLAKMGDTFQDTGGGRFILSSEEEGNFDLHGMEDELDEVYQQQLQAKVVGRVTDDDTQPRIMEVDEVHPA